jgi:hypothetical protein
MSAHAANEKSMASVLTFPGRWVGGIALILGPLLLLTGVMLRLRFHFFFPEQLAAYQAHPFLMDASYCTFAAGNVLMWPAVLTLTGLIAAKRAGWALWGGIFAISGLFARTFHAGVDHLAFQLVRVQNLDLATKSVADSYGVFHIFSTFNLAIMLGWVVLAIGAYLSGTLPMPRSIALALMSALPLGVLKGTTPFSIVATVGLCAVLVPLGVKVLGAGPMPSLRSALGWLIAVAAVGYVFFFFGQQG